MATLLSYTTYDDIRAALGVSSDELEDTTLSLAVYQFGLSADVRAVSLTLASDVATVRAKAVETRTEQESVLLEAMTLFATYSVAKQLLGALPLFAPKEMTDGKAGQARFALDPYKATIKSVNEDYGRYRAALVTAYADYKSSSTDEVPLIPLLRVSTPSSDPVLGT